MLPERDSIDVLRINARVPAPGQFILGASLIGSTATLGGTYITVDLLPKAVEQVDITRGVEPDWVSPKPITGTARITLLNPTHKPLIGQTLTIDYISPASSYTDTIFTGRIADIAIDSNEATGDKHYTYTLYDRVSTIANTPRYASAAHPYFKIEQTKDRLERLALGQPSTSVERLTTNPATHTYFQDLGYVASAHVKANWIVESDTIAAITPIGGNAIVFSSVDGALARVPITGLTPGRWYGLRANFGGTGAGIPFAAIDNPNPTANTFVSDPTDSSPFPINGFIAKSDRAMLYVRIPGGTGDTMYCHHLRLFTLSDTCPVMHSETVHESNLAAHLDQVCAGDGGAAWYVNRKDVLVIDGKARVTPQYGILVQADAWTEVSQMELMDYDRSESIQDVVNTVTIDTHQTSYLNDGIQNADDRTDGPYSDITSRATYGAMSLSIETQLGTEQNSRALATATLARFSEPKERTRTVRISGNQSNPDSVPAIEPFSYVSLDDGRGTTDYALIATITHTITPTYWLIDLTLLP